MLKDVEYLAFANLSYYDWHKLFESEKGRDIREEYSVAEMLERLKDLLNPLAKELSEITQEKEERTVMKIENEKRMLKLSRREREINDAFRFDSRGGRNSVTLSNDKRKALVEEREILKKEKELMGWI